MAAIGRVSNPLTALAAEEEVDPSSVICLSSRAKAGLSKLAFGSTAQGVLEASDRPVLPVRPGEP